MEVVYQDILLSYMKRDYVIKTDLSKINPADENQLLKPSTVYLGIKVLNQVKINAVIQRPDLLNEFYKRCTDFLKVSCIQIKKRYDFSNPILQSVNVLNPSVALSINKRDTYPSLFNLTQLLPRIVNTEDLQKIDDQWRSLPLHSFTDNIVNEKEPDKF